ncbi:MAG: hypothetical protein FJ087_11390, partial [Deltaproteobacteria bacterium]|nr:hypothetical protein [Deltaproteobacteria bacterium]
MHGSTTRLAALALAAATALVFTGCPEGGATRGDDGLTDVAGPDADAPIGCTTHAECAALAAGPCAKAVCGEQSRTCEVVVDPAKEGATCDPDDACALTPKTCKAGVCEYDKRRECVDEACRAAAGCNPLTGECSYQPKDDGETCDADGNPCTKDGCAAGECKVGANECACETAANCPPNPDKCAGPLECDPGTKRCVPGKPVECPAGTDPCSPQACDPGTGQCAPAPKPDGTECATPDPCDKDTRCIDGACEGGPKCADENACTDDQCDPATGACAYQPLGPPATCDDGDPCTSGDACEAGVCIPGAGCDDLDPCTADTCVAGKGCEHAPDEGKGCDDNDNCTSDDACDAQGECAGAPKACSDDNPCTDDSCAPATGECVNANNTAGCDDGDPCTGPADACAGGTCGGPAIWGCCKTDADCSDGDPCTDESCGEDHACWRPGEPAGLCGAPSGCAFQACEPSAADPGLHACRDLVLSMPARVIEGTPGDPGFVWTNETHTAFALPGRRVPAGVRVLHVRIPPQAACEAVSVVSGGDLLPATTGCSRQADATTAAFAWTDAADGPLDVAVVPGGQVTVTGVTLYAWAGAGCRPLGPVLVAGGSTYSDLAVAGSGGEVLVGYRNNDGMFSAAAAFADPVNVTGPLTEAFAPYPGRFTTSLLPLADGNYLLAYGGANNRIVLVTLAPDGTKVAEEKLAAYDPVDDQFEPALLATAAGPRLFWTSSKADGQDSGIATALLPSGAPVAVNPTAAGRQHSPAV